MKKIIIILIITTIFLAGCGNFIDLDSGLDYIGSPVPYSENPRYLEINEIPVFLLGASEHHSWAPISRPQVDIPEQLDRIEEVIDSIDSPHIRGYVRWVPYDPMNHFHDGDVDRVVQPWQKNEDGKFDLSKFNSEWKERLIMALEEARDRGIIVSLEIWDDWSVSWNWDNHPYHPDNNINYDNLSAPQGDYADFYLMIDKPDSIVLELQKKYVDHLLDIVKDFPHVIYCLGNESLASLEWSNYWADYLGERLPENKMIGDMPSRINTTVGGDSESQLNPLTVSIDPRYSYVDVGQAISRARFSRGISDPISRGNKKIKEYQEAMIDNDGLKPMIASKIYSNDTGGGTAAIWGRFTGGTTGARFHRVLGENVSLSLGGFILGNDQQAVDFQFKAIKRLGKFISKTKFWKMKPLDNNLVTEVPQGTNGTSVIGQENIEYVVQLVSDSSGDSGNVEIEIEPGEWSVEIYDPVQDEVKGNSIKNNTEEHISLEIPEYEETLIILIQKK